MVASQDPDARLGWIQSLNVRLPGEVGIRCKKCLLVYVPMCFWHSLGSNRRAERRQTVASAGVGCPVL